MAQRIGEFVLLADPHLVLEPYLYGCDRREFCADFRHAYCDEAHLQAAHRGRNVDETVLRGGFVPLAGVESIVLSEPVEAEAIAAFASSYEARVVAASEGALGSADGSHGRQGNVLPDGPDLRAPAAPSEAALSCSFPDGSDR
jgi:hypothetical protein